MDELKARHRKEAKDLQARIISKKKQASKKTRKGVNDECDRLEQELRDKHAAELAAEDGETVPSEGVEEEEHAGDNDLANVTGALSINGSSTTSETKADAPQSTETSAQPAGQSHRPNRARARMERRKAEQKALFAQGNAEASTIPDLKAAERKRMVANFKSRGLEEKEIRADGHCLYSAFADQMDFQGLPLGSAPEGKPKVSVLSKLSNGIKGPSMADQVAKLEEYKVVRQAAGDFMEQHPDDFAPFMEEDLETYVHKIKETAEWGGQMELIALARQYGVQINVLQGDGRVEEIKPEGESTNGKVLWMAYYKHGFGLGEHYNSLRKAG